jgi:Polysaccharide biosynthesis C-terminal domain
LDTLIWPAGSVLQAMTRHRPLAFMAVGSGIVNLAPCILLLARFGTSGMALGTLIPTPVETCAFVLPYAARAVSGSAGDLLRHVALPALLPTVPLLVELHLLAGIVAPTSLLTIVLLTSVSLLTYVLGYLAIGAGELERRVCCSVIDDLAQLLSGLSQPPSRPGLP